MACDDCLNRRAFLAKSALVTAALMIAEGCGDGQIGAPTRVTANGADPDLPLSPSVTVRLADYPELATVGTLVALGNGSERAVVRTGTDTFRGLSIVCTHQQCDTEVKNNRFECPCHGSVFAADGSVIHGPDVASPPISPLRTLAVTFDPVAGTISVA